MVRQFNKQKLFKIGLAKFSRCTGFVLLVLALLWGGMATYLFDVRSVDTASALAAADPSTIAACGGNPECFAFSIDTTLDSTGGHTNTTTAFVIPTSGYVNGYGVNNPYNWIVNWGDGTADQTASGTSSSSSAGISHTYATPGQYQITIRPSGAATSGWMNAFGFGSSYSGGANTDANKYMFYSIDTPFTNFMRSQGSISRFADMFDSAVNAIGIPDNLFANISTAGDDNFSSMFSWTFYGFAQNSTTATIPAGLFDSIDTSQGTNFDWMFDLTFHDFATNSTVATIPAGLFDSIDTRQGTSFICTFNSTFNRYAMNSTVATVPPDLFGSIYASQGAMVVMMFNDIFSGYATRTASFSVNGSIVPSLTQSFLGPYSVKNLTTGEFLYFNVNPGDIIVPTYYTGYSEDYLTILPPTDPAYSDFVWYRTDGTSCAVAHPTPDCGQQDASKLVTFPNDTEWTPDTSTEHGSVTFYAATPLPVTVTFDSNGGSTIAHPTVEINAGSVVNPPADAPTRDGYTFAGWYSDKALANRHDFAKSVTSDLTLFAKWIDNNPGPEPPVTPPTPPGPTTPVLPGPPNTSFHF